MKIFTKKYIENITLVGLCAASVLMSGCFSGEEARNEPTECQTAGLNSPSNCSAWQGLISYTGNEPLDWYAQLERMATDTKTSANFEETALQIIAEEKLSDEAFIRLCTLLKHTATESSVKALEKYLLDEKRCVSACEVIMSVGGKNAEAELRFALSKCDINSPCAKTLMFSLSNFGKDSANSDSFERFLANGDAATKECAAIAFGSVNKDNAERALDSLLKFYACESDATAKSAIASGLVKIASTLIENGKQDSALKAISVLPDGTLGKTTIVAKAESDPARRVNFLVYRMLQNGKDFGEAARDANDQINFDNGETLAKNFSAFDKKGKLALISLFAQSADPRFYPIIENEILSSDKDIRSSAIFAARYLANDKEQLKRILEIAESKNPEDKDVAKIAENALIRNPFRASDELLKAKGNSLYALELRIQRADNNAFDILEKMFLENPEDKEISSSFERSITVGNLPDFIKKYKSCNDDTIKRAIVRTTIKTLAKLQEKGVIQRIATEIVGDNIPTTDKNFKVIETKLKIDMPQDKVVWQNGYFDSAVSDEQLKLAIDPEPSLNQDGFKSLFDGKTLKGWRTTTGNATYEVLDNSIVGTVDPEMRKSSYLATLKNDYKNFLFTCDFKWLEHGNSGVAFYGVSGNDGTVTGPVCAMDDSKRAWTGGIEKGKWIYSLSLKDHEKARKAVKLDDWNRMTILCDNGIAKTWINGVPVADAKIPGNGGFIGLQIKVGKTGKIAWKNLKIKEIEHPENKK